MLGATASAAPPLTLELAGKATSYMEWLLDVPFNAEQQQRYQQVLSDTWRGNNQGAIEAVVSMAHGYDKLSAISEPDRSRIRERVQAEFLKLLAKGTDADSTWLLGLYTSAHNGTTVAHPTPAATGGPIVGRWTSTHVSSIQYRNSYNGVSAPTNGNSFAYEFHPDGTYSFTGLMQSVMYNCTMAVFSNETGTYTIDGSSVSLKPEKNPYKMTNSCAPSSNHESPGKLVPRAYRFRTAQDDNWTKLELIDSTGAVQSFSRQR